LKKIVRTNKFYIPQKNIELCPKNPIQAISYMKYPPPRWIFHIRGERFVGRHQAQSSNSSGDLSRAGVVIFYRGRCRKAQEILSGGIQLAGEVQKGEPLAERGTVLPMAIRQV
jgi:hypothetical protein